MQLDNLTFEKLERYATITIHRPDKLNALNNATLEELGDLLKDIQQDIEVRALIITGSGKKAFVAGADISEIRHLPTEKAGTSFSEQGQTLFDTIEALDIPVIAAINGFALGGGCELAMACHLRIASSNARLGLPEINLGLVPGYGGTQRLPRLIGRSTALYMLLTGSMIDADQALRWGLLNEVVTPEDLMPRVTSLANQLAHQAPLAIQHMLQLLRKGTDTRLETALSLEASAFGKLTQTEDTQEGTTAFLEKRKPIFKGK